MLEILSLILTISALLIRLADKIYKYFFDNDPPSE